MTRSQQEEARRLLAELLRLAAQLDIEVVREPIEEAQGGLCRIYDRYFLYLDPQRPLLDQIDVVIEALAPLPTEHLYLRPRLRQRLERARARSGKPRSPHDA